MSLLGDIILADFSANEALTSSNACSKITDPMNVACLLVPDFLVAIARRDNPRLAGRPVVIGGAPEEHARVRACSPEALDAGVEPGMTLRRALALCPNAVFLPYSESQSAVEADRLLDCIEAVSPVVEAVAPGHIHFETRGLARLAGLDEAAFLAEIQESAAGASGLPVQLAGAETIFAAHSAAVCMRPLTPSKPSTGKRKRQVAAPAATAVLVPPGQSKAYLAGMPVEVLPFAPGMHLRLRLFGLETLGQVAALPFSAMQAQFGRDGARAWELANGEDDSRIISRREELQVREFIELPAPATSLGPLVAGTQALIQRALEREELRNHSLRRLDWTAALESGEDVARRFVFREPTADGARMLFVVRGRLEHLQLPAPVTSLSVTLSGLCSEYGHQANLWPIGPRRQRELLDAIAQLNTREGGPQVFRIVEVQPWSRIPERQLALAAFSGQA